MQVLSKIMLALLRQRLIGSLTTSLSKLVSTAICIGIGQKQQFPRVLDDTVIIDPYQEFVEKAKAVLRQRLTGTQRNA